MSVKIVCDKCGKEVGSIDDESVDDDKFYACEVTFNGEPYYTAADLCPECVEKIKNTVDNIVRKKPRNRKAKDVSEDTKTDGE